MRPILLAFAVWAVAAGCGTTGTSQTAPTESPKEETGTKMVAAAWPTDVKIHKDGKGNVVCPVLKETIASPDKAQGFQDFEGVRYYFCCGGCPEKFKADPSKYAERPDPRNNAPKGMGG